MNAVCVCTCAYGVCDSRVCTHDCQKMSLMDVIFVSRQRWLTGMTYRCIYISMLRFTLLLDCASEGDPSVLLCCLFLLEDGSFSGNVNIGSSQAYLLVKSEWLFKKRLFLSFDSKE